MLATLGAVLMFILVINRPYPVITDYYLEDSIIASVQYHHDFWDRDYDDFYQFVGSEITPFGYFVDSYDLPIDYVDESRNFGALLVAENSHPYPIFFIKANETITLTNTDIYTSIRIDDWIVLSPNANVLAKVTYLQNDSGDKISWFSHPNVSMIINWNALHTVSVPDELFNNFFFSTTPNPVLLTNIQQHIPKFITKTVVRGDFVNDTLQLSGSSVTPARHVLPPTLEQKYSHTITRLKNAQTLSIHQPLKRLYDFRQILKELHNVLSFSMNNYVKFYSFDAIDTITDIERVTMSKSPEYSLFSIHTIPGFDWKGLVESWMFKGVSEITVTLPDGTTGQELVRTTVPVEFTENSFSINENVYYYQEYTFPHVTHILFSNVQIEELSSELVQVELDNEDYMFNAVEMPTLGTISLDLFTRTDLLELEHEILITKTDDARGAGE